MAAPQPTALPDEDFPPMKPLRLPRARKTDPDAAAPPIPAMAPEGQRPAAEANAASPPRDAVTFDLPLLMRPPGTRFNALGRKIDLPYAKHHFIDPQDDDTDPYADVIVWAKVSGHPYWPCRVGSAVDRDDILGNRSLFRFPPSQSLSLYTEANDGDFCPMWFLGSQQLGVVRRTNCLNYVEHFAEMSKKVTSDKRFVQGLEEADGEAMRAAHPNGTGRCMACGGSQNPDSIVLCDRCNGEMHLACLRPPLAAVPDGDWFCPMCRFEAPLSVAASAQAVSRPRKTKKASPLGAAAGGGPGTGASSSPSAEDRDVAATSLAAASAGSGGAGSGAADGGSEKSSAAAAVAAAAAAATTTTTTTMTTTTSAKPKSGSAGNILSSPWTAEEDAALEREVLKHGGVEWWKIAMGVPTRSEQACRSRWHGVLKVRRPMREAFVPRPTPVYRRPSASSSVALASSGAGSGGANSSSLGLNSSTTAASVSSRPVRAAAVAATVSMSSAFEKSASIPSPATLSSTATMPVLPGPEAKKPRRAVEAPSLFNSLLESLDTAQQTPAVSAACGVCGHIKAWVACSRCDAMYHGFCLGDAAPASLKEPWECPRHRCAVCAAVEPENARIDPRPVLFDVMGTSRLRKEREAAALSSSEASSATSSKAKAAPTTSTTTKPDARAKVTARLMRCAECPLALCSLHVGAPVGSNHVPVVRNHGSYFGCERCAGLSGLGNGSYAPELPPRIALARLLDRVLSEVVLFHARVAAPFVLNPPPSITASTAQAYETVRNALPVSLGELQKNVRVLKYADVQVFKTDAQKMAEFLATLYGPRHPRLAEAALSVPVVLSEILSRHTREIAQAQAALPDHEKREPWSTDFNKSSSTSSKEQSLMGLTPWESYSRRSFSRVEPEWSLDLDVPEQGPLARRPSANEAFCVVIQALEAAKLLPAEDYKVPGHELLTPGREELEELFEDHSARLRAALQSAARMRKACLRVYDALEGDRNGVLTIGAEQGYAAEAAASNRSLMATLEQTKAMLKVERMARLALEEEKRARAGERDS